MWLGIHIHKKWKLSVQQHTSTGSVLLRNVKKTPLLKRISLAKAFWKDINGLDLEFRFGEYRMPNRWQATSSFCVFLCFKVPEPDFQNTHLPLILLKIQHGTPLKSGLCVINWALNTNYYFKTGHFNMFHLLSSPVFFKTTENSEKSRFCRKELSW